MTIAFVLKSMLIDMEKQSTKIIFEVKISGDAHNNDIIRNGDGDHSCQSSANKIFFPNTPLIVVVHNLGWKTCA